MIEEQTKSPNLIAQVLRAVRRAWIPILTVALAYLLSVGAGMLMVHRGNTFALATRDKIVSAAQSGPILTALDRNDRMVAALLDSGGNLLGAVSNTLEGFGVVFPYPFIAYRGWIGGIVSADSAHASRLANPAEAVYYLITLLLQLIPFTLAAGAGVNVGIANFKPKPYYQGETWLTLPKEALLDMLRLYLLVVPLFLLASLWEFLMR